MLSKVWVKKEEGRDVLRLLGESSREKKNEYLILFFFAGTVTNIQERVKPAELPSTSRAGGMRAKSSMKSDAQDKLESSAPADSRAHTHEQQKPVLQHKVTQFLVCGNKHALRNVLLTSDICVISPLNKLSEAVVDMLTIPHTCTHTKISGCTYKTATAKSISK